MCFATVSKHLLATFTSWLCPAWMLTVRSCALKACRQSAITLVKRFNVNIPVAWETSLHEGDHNTSLTVSSSSDILAKKYMYTSLATCNKTQSYCNPSCKHFDLGVAWLQARTINNSALIRRAMQLVHRDTTKNELWHFWDTLHFVAAEQASMSVFSQNIRYQNYEITIQITILWILAYNCAREYSIIYRCRPAQCHHLMH